jgi:hypothetical protein
MKMDGMILKQWQQPIATMLNQFKMISEVVNENILKMCIRGTESVLDGLITIYYTIYNVSNTCL